MGNACACSDGIYNSGIIVLFTVRMFIEISCNVMMYMQRDTKHYIWASNTNIYINLLIPTGTV